MASAAEGAGRDNICASEGNEQPISKTTTKEVRTKMTHQARGKGQGISDITTFLGFRFVRNGKQKIDNHILT